MTTIVGSLARLYEESGQVEPVARLRQVYGDMTVPAAGAWAIPSYSEPLQLPLPRFFPMRLPPLFARVTPWSSQCDRPAQFAPSTPQPDSSSAEQEWMDWPRIDPPEVEPPGLYRLTPPEPDPASY
ncbi:MAG: hypothetical protein WBA57_18695 [Elainellaceae cyanobacterium]